MSRIKIDLVRCIGSARCRAQAPHTFAIVGDHSQVTNPQGDPIEAIIKAAQSCPTQAIAAFDEEGKPLFVPQ
jgi:ferredoxin